jgi:HlyD family secretion protein
MVRKTSGASLRYLGPLFDLGVASDLTDGQLLERFAAGPGSAAELAFAVLLERHGAMVLRVCRGILRDEHAAMDAFQATFLVLIHKSRWLWVRESLGPWLHRAACRAAGRLKRESTRRRRLAVPSPSKLPRV